MVKLNARAVMQLRIPIPQENKEQAAILSVAGTKREVLATLTSDLASMERFKHGLMHDLLTGRVAVPLPWSDALIADA